VISAGLDNKYGHPNQEVIDIFTQFKEKVLETLGGGMIIFQSDGQNIRVSN
jgi:beta-lactamase superfamily II metal-dependent hydrolase